MKNNSEKKIKLFSSAVLSVFASKSLCVCHSVVILYLSVMVPVLSKKIPNKQKSKTKAFPEKPKLPVCYSSILM